MDVYYKDPLDTFDEFILDLVQLRSLIGHEYNTCFISDDMFDKLVALYSDYTNRLPKHDELVAKAIANRLFNCCGTEFIASPMIRDPWLVFENIEIPKYEN